MAGKARNRCKGKGFGGGQTVVSEIIKKALAEARRQSRNIGDKAGGWNVVGAAKGQSRKP